MRYEILVDDDPVHPRKDWDNLGTILYTSYRYLLGDERVDGDEIKSKMTDPSVIALPVYAYIHSGVMLNTGGFSCQWDSGQSGCIYISKEKVREEFKVKRISPKLHKRVEEILKSEVKLYSQYLEGDIYGYRIFDDQGEEVDSCWGLFGREYAEEAAQEAMQAIAKDAA